MNNQITPIKVLHFTCAIRRGGKERQLFTIYKHSTENIYNKIVSIYKSNSSYLNEYDVRTEDIYFLDTKNNLLRLWRFYKIAKKEKPDIIFAWDMLSFVIALLSKPFVSYRVINASVQHGIKPHTWRQYMRKFLLHLSKHIVANSNAGLKANNLKRGFVLYNGTDPGIFKPGKHNSKLTHERNLSIHPIYVSVANLVPYKDYFTVIEALSVLHQQHKQFTYLILGEGPNRNFIRQRILANGLEDKVQLLGAKSNVIDYLHQADIFIHSSKGEGISNAILEAMFSGLPVIASRVGGVPETVCQQYGSLLFEYKDKEGLVECLLQAEGKFRNFNPQNDLFLEHLEKFTIKVMLKRFAAIINKVALPDQNIVA